jgi:hypothetical protein
MWKDDVLPGCGTTPAPVYIADVLAEIRNDAS